MLAAGNLTDRGLPVDKGYTQGKAGVDAGTLWSQRPPVHPNELYGLGALLSEHLVKLVDTTGRAHAPRETSCGHNRTSDLALISTER